MIGKRRCAQLLINYEVTPIHFESTKECIKPTPLILLEGDAYRQHELSTIC